MSVNEGPPLTHQEAGRLRVRQVFYEYSLIHNIPTAVMALYDSPSHTQMFRRCMENDYRRLLPRSLDLSRFEVNVYEAAFIMLMRAVETQVGAIQIYVDEILGLKSISTRFMKQALGETVLMRSMLLDCKACVCPEHHVHFRAPFLLRIWLTGSWVDAVHEAKAENFPGLHETQMKRTPQAAADDMDRLLGNSIPSSSTNNLYSATTNRTTSSSTHKLPISHTTFPSIQKQQRPLHLAPSPMPAMDDPHLTTLLSIYRNAKPDFYSSSPTSTSHTPAARFLQNTAEKCIAAMSRANANDIRLGEIRQTLFECSLVTGTQIEKPGLKRELEVVSQDDGEEDMGMREPVEESPRLPVGRKVCTHRAIRKVQTEGLGLKDRKEHPLREVCGTED